MNESLFFIFMMLSVSLYFIWSKHDTINYCKRDTHADQLAYYQGWDKAQQDFSKVVDK